MASAVKTKIPAPSSSLSNLFSSTNLQKFARELKPEEFIVQKRLRVEEPTTNEDRDDDDDDDNESDNEKKVKVKEPKKKEGKKKKWDEAKRKEVDALKKSGEWKVICDANHAAAISNQGKEKTEKTEQKEEKDEDEIDDVNAESIGPAVTDGSKDDFTAFFGNVPKSETVKTLKKFCTQFGEVESVRLRSIPVAGTAVDDAGNQNLVRKVCAISRNYADVKGSLNAYVVFKNKESVKVALEANNRMLGTRHLRVDTAKLNLFDPKRSVFVGSLPHYTDEEDLRNHFAKALQNGQDDIEAVRLVRDPESLIGKGIGYILFKDRDSVLKALSLHESIFRKRNLRVTICGKSSKRIKQTLKGEDPTKNKDNFLNKGKRSYTTSNGTGNASIKGKRSDNDDVDEKGNKRQKPAFMSRKSDSEIDLNTKNANKRINLKSINTRNKTLVANKQKKAEPGRKGKRLGGVVKRAMKAAGTKKK